MRDSKFGGVFRHITNQQYVNVDYSGVINTSSFIVKFYTLSGAAHLLLNVFTNAQNAMGIEICVISDRRVDEIRTYEPLCFAFVKMRETNMRA